MAVEGTVDNTGSMPARVPWPPVDDSAGRRERADFSSVEWVRATSGLRVGVPDLPDLEHFVRREFPRVEIVPMSATHFFAGRGERVDGLAFPAERGSYFMLLYPAFSVAVLVNDFGAINIDADLAVGVEDDTVSLANGCIYCIIRDDLVQTVTEVIERPEKPEYILLEASGVAEPSGIAGTFLNPAFRDRVRLDSIRRPRGPHSDQPGSRRGWPG